LSKAALLEERKGWCFVRRARVAAWRVAVLFLILHGALRAHAWQERRARDVEALTGTSTIRGRVVAASGGAGIGDAIVTAVETISGFTSSVTSDSYGAFLMENIPGGRYVLAATKPTFITGRYGQQTSGGTRRVLALAEGKTTSDVEIRLWKAGIITGKIETPLGERLPGATVNVMRSSVDGDVRRVLPIRPSAVTSDTGEYRIYGVDPGSYYIVATPPPLTLRKGLARNMGYRPTFYPDAAGLDSAQRVSVAVEATTVADILMQTSRLITVDGTLLDPRGSLPAASANGIRVHAGADGLAVQPKAIVFDGRFSFPALPEGAYTFHSDTIKDAEGRSVVFLADAYIDGQESTRVSVSLSGIRTGAITGTVRLPRGVTLAESLSVQIGANPRFDTKSMGPSPPVRIDKNHTFRFLVWPGLNRIVARVENRGLYVKAIWLGGVDITDEAVTVNDGIDLEGLELELTDVTQTLSGRVTIQSGSEELVEDLAVVVFPVDRHLWASNRRTALAPLDKRGEFNVRSLPPGAYAAAVVPFRSGLSFRDPGFLESVQNTAQVLSLSEGATVTLVLRR
jgi:hypothetical protein